MRDILRFFFVFPFSLLNLLFTFYFEKKKQKNEDCIDSTRDSTFFRFRIKERKKAVLCFFLNSKWILLDKASVFTHFLGYLGHGGKVIQLGRRFKGC